MDAVTRHIAAITDLKTCLMEKLWGNAERLRKEVFGKQKTKDQDRENRPSQPWQWFKRFQFQTSVRKEFVPRPTWEPGIEAGYRKPYKPLRYYFMSLFQWHNESINVWTHLLGSIVVVAYMIHYNSLMDYWYNKKAWPHFMLGVCSLVCTSASGVCHLIHSRSALTHYVTFSFDYAGAGIFGFGTNACVLYYSSDDDIVCYVGKYFLPINVCLYTLMCFCCCYGKAKYSLHHHLRRKLWFVVPTAPAFLAAFCIAIPRFVNGCYIDPNPDPQIVQSWTLHFYHLVCFFAALFFFLSHVPEVFFHGEFDNVLHGHQFWHVLLVCTMIFQLRATHFDYLNRSRRQDALDNLPGYEEFFYYVLALIILDLLVIYCASRIARRVVEEEQQELDDISMKDSADESESEEEQIADRSRTWIRASMGTRLERRKMAEHPYEKETRVVTHVKD